MPEPADPEGARGGRKDGTVRAVTARPVLLVHGFASSFERNWREPGWADLLADAGREVIAVDLLGHGGSPKPHDPAAYADLGASVRAALPSDGPVDAIGFSLGAAVLLGVAAADPGRFDHLVIAGVGANLFRDGDPEPIAMAVERGEAVEGDPPSAGAFARFAQSEGNDPVALAACLRRPAEPLRATDLGAIDRPVLVVLGDRDTAGPAEPLLDALPDARLVTLRGVDHFATPKDFGFIDAALDFIGAST